MFQATFHAKYVLVVMCISCSMLKFMSVTMYSNYNKSSLNHCHSIIHGSAAHSYAEYVANMNSFSKIWIYTASSSLYHPPHAGSCHTFEYALKLSQIRFDYILCISCAVAYEEQFYCKNITLKKVSGNQQQST